MFGDPQVDTYVIGGLAFLVAFLFGTFVEYAVHRLMHRGKMLGKKHAEHHQDGWGQGWAGEFWDYIVGTIPVVVVVGLVAYFAFGSLPWAIGFAAGGVSYAVLAAYAHQLQHERPELVFWMKRPVHHLHHKHHMWKHNFGILVDFWDRICGTYRAEPWAPPRRPFQHSLLSFFRIKWF
jgi:sterol desaturase/sphingolipid hydroxylase (fatty acid hydroxylase superfamily)